MPLTDRAIKAAKAKEKDYKVSDEKGLFLLVTKSGSKLFKMKYRFNGKEKKLSFGAYPDINLKEAREKRDEARKLLAHDIDPSAHKKAIKAAQRLNSENSFNAIALEWFDTKLADKTDGHQRRVKRALEIHLFPTLGNHPIKDITAPVLLEALRVIEGKGSVETAHRVKQITGQVFRYAIATGRAERDPTPDLKGALRPSIPKHFSALTDPRDVGRLLIAIDEFQGTPTVKAALKLSALFFCRPGELRNLKWSDINHEESRIELVAEKTHQQHIIPLCTQAKEILNELHPHTGNGDFIFPSARGRSRCMSENAVRVALRTMGYDNDTMTPHGFRAMARTLLDEVLGFRVEWIEQQLAHAVKDANGRAYNRTKHLTQRTEMMQKWADYLDGLKQQALSGNVVSVNFKQA
ncbi:tyrosine-type recombinase/integrase [Aliamphritea hakodatensis]|uniref:tyrosine-type recombinase/integrase n=1 Tax=Aliamphritea hakodatensis TaxID=2895352 RepID=UPI0022FD82D3|nr:integrase arm-type DNA-binding domain-containing protein [Aliamphritea hakodatensis]